MSTAFSVVPATLEDVPGIVDVLLAGFDMLKKLFPHTPEGREWTATAFRNFIESKPGKQPSRVFVSHDEKGKPVGFAIYFIVDGTKGGIERWDQRWPELIPSQQTFEDLDGFFTPMEKNHAKVMGEESHVFLEVIATSASVRGMGIGGKLVQAGEQLADELDVSSYLDARPVAVTLYQRAGYVVQDTGLTSPSCPMKRPRTSEREPKAQAPAEAINV